MNELKTKTEKTTDGVPKKEPVAAPPRGRQNRGHCCRHSGVLAVLAALYVNGKLDLLRYDDGSVERDG